MLKTNLSFGEILLLFYFVGVLLSPIGLLLVYVDFFLVKQQIKKFKESVIMENKKEYRKTQEDEKLKKSKPKINKDQLKLMEKESNERKIRR